MIADFRLTTRDCRRTPAAQENHPWPSTGKRKSKIGNRRNGLAVARQSAPVLPLGKRINDAQALEAAEITIMSQQFGNAVLQAQGGNMSVVNQIACRTRLANNTVEQGNMSFGFSQQNNRWRRQDVSQIVERNLQRDRWVKHPGVRYHTKELVNARPWDRPRQSAFGQTLEQLKRGSVVAVGFDFGVNQDIRIDRLHGSPPVHELEKGVAIRQINSGEFGGLPSAKTQLIRRAGGSCQRTSQEVIRRCLEGPPFLGGLFLQGSEQRVINLQGGSLHMQKHTCEASRCQSGRQQSNIGNDSSRASSVREARKPGGPDGDAET